VPGAITEVLLARTEVIEQRSADVQRAIDAIFAAQARYAADESGLIARVAQLLGKPATELGRISGEVVVSDRAGSRARLIGDGPLSLARLTPVQVEQLRARGQLPPGFVWSSLIDARFLGPR
jgi:hypothetical protein